MKPPNKKGYCPNKVKRIVEVKDRTGSGEDYETVEFHCLVTKKKIEKRGCKNCKLRPKIKIF